jgi:hypothetical protein
MNEITEIKDVTFCFSKDNFEGEEDMHVLFEAITKQKQGFFLYLTHIYPKTSVNYNFYAVK